jgi:hypothetical protein
MKLQLNQTDSILKSLSTKEIKFLTNEVKETLCTDLKSNRQKFFSAAQLWNIQRHRKNVSFQKSYL